MSKIVFQKISGKGQLVQTVKNLAVEIWHEHFTAIFGMAQVDYLKASKSVKLRDF